MPRIASHHLPGGWRSTGANAHVPVCAWPEDCYVQWGASGVVFSAKGNYRTAFFEAFPKQPDTFIRGEGATVAEAEQAAFAKFARQAACVAHEFERGTYRNGSGHCKHCRMFSSEAFEPLEQCCVCAKPTYFTGGTDAAGVTYWYCEEHADQRCKVTRPNAFDKLMDDESEDEGSASGVSGGDA